MRRAVASRLRLAVDEQQIHRPLIHGDGNERPTETEGQGRNVVFDQGVDEQRETAAGHRREQGEHAQPRTRKAQQEQKRDTNGRRQDSQICIVCDEGFVVDGRTVPTHRCEQDAVARLPRVRCLELPGHLAHERIDRVAGLRVARAFAGRGDDEQVLPFAVENVAPLDARLLRRHQLAQASEHEIPQPERILGHAA